LDRYICVEPIGPWGFVNAVNELFRRSGKSANNIKHVGGRPEWFDIAAIAEPSPHQSAAGLGTDTMP
jgi:hypothetical protein